MQNDLIKKSSVLDMLYNYEYAAEAHMRKGLMKATVLQTLREIIGHVERMYEPELVKVETNLFDKEEIYQNCTVQILTNTVTGEVSVGWWKNDREDDRKGHGNG